MTAALAVAVLAAAGVYLLLQRDFLRVVVGFVLLGHAVNVVLISAGGMHRRGAPLVGETDPGQAADPLPQAFVLTAIVISFGITVYLLGLLRAGGDRPDETEPGETEHRETEHRETEPGETGTTRDEPRAAEPEDGVGP